jgi:GTP-binding protein
MLVSAKTGWHTEKILDEILKVAAERRKEISEKELNYFLRAVLKEKKPLKTRGFRHPYIYRIKQVKSAPPVFMLAIRAKAPVNNAYLKFIEKRLRDKFGFEGTPVKITQKVV